MLKAKAQHHDQDEAEYPNTFNPNIQLLIERNKTVLERHSGNLLGDEWNLKKKNSNFLMDL